MIQRRHHAFSEHRFGHFNVPEGIVKRSLHTSCFHRMIKAEIVRASVMRKAFRMTSARRIATALNTAT